MSGALLFWIIVLLCWSIASQLTICTSRVVPVLALYFSANCFQNAAVWSLEYSAATSLMEVTFLALLPAAGATGCRAAAAAAAAGGQPEGGHGGSRDEDGHSARHGSSRSHS